MTPIMERQRYKIPIPDATRDLLEQWAAMENRSFSNLVETILMDSALEWARNHISAIRLGLKDVKDHKLVVINEERREIATYDYVEPQPLPNLSEEELINRVLKARQVGIRKGKEQKGVNRAVRS